METEMAYTNREKNLLDFPHAFEVDRSWYQSHWYDAPQPRPARRSVQIAVWVAILCFGAYIGL
jgi:hypothetical protein